MPTHSHSSYHEYIVCSAKENQRESFKAKYSNLHQRHWKQLLLLFKVLTCWRQSDLSRQRSSSESREPPTVHPLLLSRLEPRPATSTAVCAAIRGWLGGSKRSWPCPPSSSAGLCRAQRHLRQAKQNKTWVNGRPYVSLSRSFISTQVYIYI